LLYLGLINAHGGLSNTIIQGREGTKIKRKDHMGLLKIIANERLNLGKPAQTHIPSRRNFG